MKILHLSTFDILGGASRAAYRLHQGLQRAGVDSQMLVSSKLSRDVTVRALDPDMRFLARLKRNRRRKYILHSGQQFQSTRVSAPFSDDRSPWGNDIARQLTQLDLINLHWISGFVDVQNLVAHLSPRLPVVWTLHDMNAFTGGCHYDDGCGKHTQACGVCPILGSRDENDWSQQIWRRKRDAYARLQARLFVAPASQWLAKEAFQSALFHSIPIQVIHYGLDLEIFAPRDRAFSRDVLNIPQDARVVLFTAHSLADKRKGFTLLTEAIAGLNDIGDLLLVSAGGETAAIPSNVRSQHLGVINDDRLLALAYSAADLFVIPSIQENLPQTALEAIACGIPVIGFDVGGIPDVVRSGVTGSLVSALDAAALRHAILELLNNSDLRVTLASNCRKVALQEFSLERQARDYMNLYSNILAAQTNT